MTKQLNNSKTIQKSSLEISLVGLKITKRNRKLAKTKSLLMAAKNVMTAHHLVKLALWHRSETAQMPEANS